MAISRRSLLKGGAVLGGTGAFLSFSQLFGLKSFAQDVADDDLTTIINLAATAELFATTHYLAAINSAEALGLSEEEVVYMKAGFLAEQDHLELLVSLGATPLYNEFYVPATLFSDRAVFAATTEVAETAFVGAYLAAVRVFSKSPDTTAYAVTCAQIAAVEEVHRSIVRDLGGKLSNNTSYAPFTLYNVSNAVPVLLPFLDGSGEGFVGPVAPPTADDIAAVRAEAEAIGFDAQGAPFAAMSMEEMMGGGM